MSAMHVMCFQLCVNYQQDETWKITEQAPLNIHELSILMYSMNSSTPWLYVLETGEGTGNYHTISTTTDKIWYLDICHIPREVSATPWSGCL